MPANNYHFKEYWNFPGYTPEQVFEVLANATLLPEWWKGVYLEAELLEAYFEPIFGAKARVKARGFLPYKLEFELESLRLEPGQLVEVKATGDFDGIWRAKFSSNAQGTKVEIDWRVTVNLPLIRYLSPIFKPFFAWNHNWTTPRGEQGLLAYLGQKHGRSLNALPLAA
ncbi:MAG: SRPBCC family protein [Anaerolineales bacterium]|nr:SRPBCC family protein [Anaerolineales bacterium]